jgi:hypothetical protein
VDKSEHGAAVHAPQQSVLAFQRFDESAHAIGEIGFPFSIVMNVYLHVAYAGSCHAREWVE